jgi:quinol monooxygenase YgiN
MVKFAFVARFEVRPGKEATFEKFLKNALPLAKEESEMIAWYAYRIGPSTFGVFDTFQNEEDQQAHLSAKIVTALSQQAGELLSSPAVIEKVELLAVKESQALDKPLSYSF